MSSEIRFYATRDDWIALLRPVEEQISVRYVRFGQCSHDEEPSAFASCLDIPGLGTSNSASSISSATYIICEKGTRLAGRSVGTGAQKRLVFDQLMNPETVTFTPGGFWDKVLLSGRIASASESSFSKQFLSLVGKSARKTAVKVKAYWVGVNAANLGKEGFRLTIAQQSPSNLDLKIPN